MSKEQVKEIVDTILNTLQDKYGEGGVEPNVYRQAFGVLLSGVHTAEWENCKTVEDRAAAAHRAFLSLSALSTSIALTIEGYEKELGMTIQTGMEQ